jgi:hypothetical protein
MDPGYLVIQILQKTGIAWDVKGPDLEAERVGLVRV